MFDREIDVEARQGVMLHKRDGTPYWKLILVCSREGCESEVDMGECLCFNTEEAMKHCRDNHGLHCSVKCWYEDQTRERIELVLEDIKKHNETCEAFGDGDLIIEGDDEIIMISDWWDYQADNSDPGDWYEIYDVVDCPI